VVVVNFSKSLRKQKRVKQKKLILRQCPQKKGICMKLFEGSPKKPNSACRKLAKVKFSTGCLSTCHIPGIGHTLQPFSVVLIQGAYLRDLPGVKYRIIRGKFDSLPVYSRVTSKSKYGLGVAKI
jgi:small subunit ribosomal protein S12